ncbi:MAG: hypothetical protein WD605_02950 [Candidatus Paceibacterota bacterium]
MKRDDWILLSLTFLTGLIIGMFVYITAFKPTYEAESLSGTEAEAGEWSVVGKRIGGVNESNYIQPSFRLLGNGEYTYLPGGSGGESPEPRSGKISQREMSDLRFIETELAALEQSGRLAVCQSDRGGYDYEYRISLNQNTFLLDTCLVSFNGSSLETSLDSIWQSIEGTKEARRYNSVADWLQDFLQSYFVDGRNR